MKTCRNCVYGRPINANFPASWWKKKNEKQSISVGVIDMANDPARAVKRSVKEARALHREQCRKTPCIPASRGVPICVICVNEGLVK